jgi:hypothetical protein
MAEFSPGQRVLKAVLGLAVLCGWWYFAPDYSQLLSTPLGELSLGEIWPALGWMLILGLLIYGAVSWLYEALTGHRAWFWHLH